MVILHSTTILWIYADMRANILDGFEWQEDCRRIFRSNFISKLVSNHRNLLEELRIGLGITAIAV